MSGIFKTNNTVNRKDKLNIIQQIINLNKRGGNITLTKNTLNTLDKLNKQLDDSSQPIPYEKIEEPEEPEDSTQTESFLYLLDTLQHNLEKNDHEIITKTLVKISALLNQDSISDQDKDFLDEIKIEKYKKTIIDLKKHVDNLPDNFIYSTKDSDINKKITSFIEQARIIQSPSSEQIIHKPEPVPETETETETTIDEPEPEPILDESEPTLDESEPTLNEPELEEGFLNETEQELILILINAIGLNKLNTWEKVSKKYKILYNIMSLGDNEEYDIKASLFKYSYNDISFVQNLLNFNNLGLNSWEIATKNIKNYINNLYSLIKDKYTVIQTNETNIDNDSENDSENNSDSEDNIDAVPIK